MFDCYSIKPIDTATLTAAAAATSGRLVIAEDHRPEAGLDPDHIVAAARQLIDPAEERPARLPSMRRPSC